MGRRIHLQANEVPAAKITPMIREINERDANEMVELIKQLASSTADINIDTVRFKIVDIMKLDHMKVFGYEKDGKIVGTCTLARIEGLSHGCRPFTVIENVVVLESARSNGIGRQLVRHAIDQAQAWDCYKVILETGSKNEWKLKFYEKCGLTRGGKTAFIKRF
jgi:GNAT superfamily N-acetyltransferase